MALETLKDVKEIGGFEVIRKVPDGMTWDEFDEYRKKVPIFITEHLNMISFKIQNGPIKEVGINGCQIDNMIEAAKMILEGLNKNLPCRENSIAITKLDEAILWLEKRKADRQKREVEGQNFP